MKNKNILLGVVGIAGMIFYEIGLTIVMSQALRGFGRVDLRNLSGCRTWHAA
jgi:hypothetical protein